MSLAHLKMLPSPHYSMLPAWILLTLLLSVSPYQPLYLVNSLDGIQCVHTEWINVSFS